MAPPNFALCFACLFVVYLAHTTALKQSSLHFQSASVGESITLSCFCQKTEAVMFYWYKQSVGLTPKLMSSFHSYKTNITFHGEFNNPRFSLDIENRKNQLKISDFQFSDSGTYYCLRNNFVDFEFCKGTTVTTKGSGLNIPAVVHQSASQTIQPGGSVTLNCTVHTGTCDGEHSVYWFKNSGESHPKHIYTHGGRNDQCERKPSTQTHSCVYNWTMRSLNLSHAGTYYCAVASCGHILFGNGTKLDLKYEVGSLVYILSAALSFTTVLVVLLAFTVYKMSKRKCQYTESNVIFSTTSAPNEASCQDTENLHYAALRDHKVNRSRGQRSNTNNECVYSSVKQ
uniref:immunoglobulin kappa light chain-like n=1 Tax=Scatophagus argus TaxID=75038 RepID=UPI001ED80329|nr:immunoglobulin kappa light chain-like [Scatophagus argus]